MPTIQQVHPPEFLTNLSLALMNENFIGQIIAPPIPVSRWVDRIPVYDNGTFMSAPTPADARRNSMSPALTTHIVSPIRIIIAYLTLLALLFLMLSELTKIFLLTWILTPLYL